MTIEDNRTFNVTFTQCEICRNRRKPECEPHHRMEMRLLRTCPIYKSDVKFGINAKLGIK